MRALGVDHGGQRIGIALCDPTGTVTTPWGVLPAHPRRRLRRQLARLIRDEAVALVVVGDPLTSDGSVGEQAVAARAFCDWLRTWCAVPVVAVDERWTSVQADELLAELPPPRPGAAAPSRDAVAAAMVLRAWLAAGAPGAP